MTRSATEASARRSRWLHRGFEGGILLKGAVAALEVSAGALLLLFGRQAAAFADAVTTGSVLVHPRPFSFCLVHIAAGLASGGEHFYALFFLAHGLVKGLAVIALLRRAPYAQPFAVSVLAGFVAYQLFHYVQSGSVGLLVISAFDLLLIYLILREYRPAPPGSA
ncbi:MAG: hypothetical protein DI556_00945 [Rhodovulum sulfidophilum]|uniref:DUF2127 domain-containing protein n=1 Tax=Rhodovulum sulfidophilum TaxID=35806 RepID=A0A2W5QL62_RHOSU|nr:MAG: hypothetical protein DI556_00945 [Rhodovulum sulfidophilum]